MKAKLIVSTNFGGKLLKPGDEVDLQKEQYADFLKRGLVEKPQQDEAPAAKDAK
jgi:hypothetical protein